tara:strand:- start:162 stop:533 length:372 start_codon:yes stop_codon:yes gene_type:complete
MQIKLTFTNPLNHSLQQGDTIWYIDSQDINQAGGYDVADNNNISKLGTVEEVSNQYRAHQITISNSFTAGTPDLTNAFIMFSKDNSTNLTSLTGYYALAKFENNSKEKAELYAVGSEIAESSK